MRWSALVLFAAACGCAEIEVEPTTIDWGEVDFAQPRPDDGYDARDVTIRNAGDRTVTITVRGVDEERLLVSGQFEDGYRLAPLEAGQTAVLRVGVWAYVPGEWDTLVEGSLRITGDPLRDEIPVAWSFTPIRDL